MYIWKNSKDLDPVESLFVQFLYTHLYLITEYKYKYLWVLAPTLYKMQFEENKFFFFFFFFRCFILASCLFWICYYLLSLTYYNRVLLFYTPSKHQKTYRFFNVFRGYRKGTSGCNALMLNFVMVKVTWTNSITKNNH